MGLFFSDCMIKVNFVLMKKAMQLCMMAYLHGLVRYHKKRSDT